MRVLAGLTTRDDDPDLVELPSHMSKRRYYGRHCYEQGYIIKVDDKGNFGSMSNYKVRPDYQAEDKAPSAVVSWQTFLSVWARKFPKMLIRPPCQDVCADCVVIKNSFRMTQKVKRVRENIRLLSEDTGDRGRADESGSDDDDDEFEVPLCQLITDHLSKEAEIAAKEADLLSSIRNIEGLCEKDEDIILKAHTHVLQAQVMRSFFQQKVKDAKTDRAEGIPLLQRRLCLVIDYCQNLEFPRVGAEQPGETYYLSPLWNYLFGAVDVSGEEDHLTAFCYPEGQAKKGANSVVSLVWKWLVSQGLCKEGEPANELNICADNCPGQNKNKTVVKFCNFLVEAGFFKKVNLIFLVKGHTKNPCDRMFNALKMTYRTSNIYTYSDLISNLSTHRDVTVVPCEAGPDFQDWETHLNEIYQTKPVEKVTDYHLFEFGNSRNHRVINCYKQVGSDPENPEVPDKPDHEAVSVIARKQLKLFNKPEEKLDRELLIKSMIAVGPKDLEAPGVSAIKKVEIWDEWFKISDKADWMSKEDEWQKWCPKPTEEERAKVKDDRDKRKKMREEEKKAVEAEDTENMADAAEEEAIIPSDDEEEEEDVHVNQIASHSSPNSNSYQSPARSGTRRAAGSASTPNTRSPTKKREKRNADIEVL